MFRRFHKAKVATATEAEDASSSTSPPLANINSMSPENVGLMMDSMSATLAVNWGINTCEIHENCDGTCSGPQIVHQPLSSIWNQITATGERSSRKVEPETVCRDDDWLRSQQIPKFEYCKLPDSSRSIRLLRIKQAVFRRDVLECDIKVVALDELPGYIALSYVWGEPVFGTPIMVNQQRADVTATLAAALKVYRQLGFAEKGVLLWVDALCINQADKVELKSQILLMRRIYSQAERVCIHLGEVGNEWYPGFDLLYRLNEVYEFQQRPSGYRPTELSQIWKLYRIPLLEHPAWAQYLRLYESAWFRRTWILQEIALAKQADLLFGCFPFGWSMFVNSFKFLSQHNLPGYPQLRMNKISHFTFISVGKLLAICNAARQPYEDINALLEILFSTADFRVSDPRDKVIGILGLLGDGPTSFKASLLADYSLTADDLYHRTAVHLERLTHGIELLPLAGLQRRTCARNMPSWAVDWMALSRDWGERPLVVFRPKAFQASGKLKRYAYLDRSLYCQQTGPDSSPDQLVILGKKFDSISWLSDAREIRDREGRVVDNRKEDHDFVEWLKTANNCLTQASENITLPYSNVEEAFIRTLLVNDLYTGENMVPASSPIVEVVATYKEAIAALEGSASGGALVNIFSPRKTPLQTMVMQLMAASIGRRFAVTKKGYMALVPALSVKGDVVAIIFGSNTPHVLRLAAPGEKEADGRTFAQLVGDTYVHGIMEGQALEHKEFETEEIVLI